jgi:hypothetical protein
MLQEDENHKNEEETAEQGQQEESLTVELEKVRKKEPHCSSEDVGSALYLRCVLLRMHAFLYQQLQAWCLSSCLEYKMGNTVTISLYYYLTLSLTSF